ncbi:glycolate oxidase subunit GlcD [Actinoallomurus liliacearum]|uniref:Glycolate oxidase subunit GlcD n=1 Tax=Actinoallomurus liliacearum TaxID=1080073 RepID=A0ABP8TPE7_9ACTN
MFSDRSLSTNVLRQLRSVVGDENVRTDPGVLEAYARDATPLFHAYPQAVVEPDDAPQIAEIVRIAVEHRLPVIPRGSGSNLCAATSAQQGGIVLTTARMRRIEEIAPAELLARVQPGVTTAALAKAAGEHGLFYPPDPGSHTVSTIGGNIATCAGGLRGLKYGVTRDYVLGLTAVLGTGEIVATGGRLWKDVAGYDLTRLLTGSEGTLGIITEATVALLPVPATMGTGLAYFADLAAAGHAVTEIIARGVVPATLEFLDRRCMDAVDAYAHLGLHATAGAMLLFGDDGGDDQVAASLARMRQACLDSGALSVEIGGVAEAESLLAARRCTLPALSRLGSLTILEDASVPRPRLAEMVARIDDIARRHDVVIATFGHAGDGNLHPTCVLPSAEDTEAVARAERAFGEIFRTAIALGGTITGEHGVGAAKLPYLAERLGPEQTALLRRIKSAFDPAGILNPGKLGS